jgi:hypothetical protein
MQIRTSRDTDDDAIHALNRAVAAIPGGLARLEHEVTPDYVAHFLQKARAAGLSLVAEKTTKSSVKSTPTRRVSSASRMSGLI